MSKNGIAHLPNKEDRKKAKLKLAKENKKKRNLVEPGRYPEVENKLKSKKQ